MVIPEGYKWVVLHGGWTLIPCANTDKFIPQELIPSNTSPEDPIDEELVDWGDDDDQDYLIEDVADEENFLEDDNMHIEALEDLHPVDSVLSQPNNLINDSIGDEMELNGAGNTENRHNSPHLGAQPACLPLLVPASSQIRRSDRTKKTRWNEEAGFLPPALLCENFIMECKRPGKAD